MDQYHFPEKLVECFGGLQKIEDLPHAEIDNSKFRTGYPDFIKPNELENPISTTIDSAGRYFIIFKMKYFKDDGKIYEITEVLFQRYVNELTWSGAINPSGTGIMFNNNLEYDLIKQIIQTGQVKIVNHFKFGSGMYVLI